MGASVVVPAGHDSVSLVDPPLTDTTFTSKHRLRAQPCRAGGLLSRGATLLPSCCLSPPDSVASALY